MGVPLEIWQIGADDQSKHYQQFDGLKPVNGFITGEQARSFFLKSGLASNVLAQIWNFAHVNNDDKMDRREISIAMHLIQMKSQGFALPQTLPESLYPDPEPIAPVPGSAQMPVGAVRTGGMMNPMPADFLPATGPMPMGPFPSLETPALVGSPKCSDPLTMAPIHQKSVHSVNWSMPPATKLKYIQMFNTLDKSRIGSLSGVPVRNIMRQSGLPHAVLDQIWNLSDLDKDGQLTCDEFCIAMHLMEMVKQGEPLPTATPAELTVNLRLRTLSLTHNYDGGEPEVKRRRELSEEQDREECDETEREMADSQQRERLEQEREGNVAKMETLPVDCQVHIFRFLPLKDVLACRYVSHSWKNMLSIDALRMDVVKKLKKLSIPNDIPDDWNFSDSEVDVSKILDLLGPHLTDLSIGFDKSMRITSTAFMTALTEKFPFLRRLYLDRPMLPADLELVSRFRDLRFLWLGRGGSHNRDAIIGNERQEAANLRAWKIIFGIFTLHLSSAFR